MTALLGILAGERKETPEAEVARTRAEIDRNKRLAAEAVRQGGELREVARRYGISMPTLLDARRKYAPKTLKVKRTREEKEMIAKARVKRKTRYPWDKWLTQPQTILLRGRDYRCTTFGLAQQVRQQASRRGIRVSVHTTQDSVTIELRREHGR